MMIKKILPKLRTNHENTLHGQFSSQPTHKFFWKIIFSFLTTHINLIHKKILTANRIINENRDLITNIFLNFEVFK